MAEWILNILRAAALVGAVVRAATSPMPPPLRAVLYCFTVSAEIYIRTL